MMLGAIIFYENQGSPYGIWHRSDTATLMEECRKDIFEPNGFISTRMYEKEGIKPSIYECDYPLNHSNVLAEWVKGYGIVCMLGQADSNRITRLLWQYDDGDNIPEEKELKYITFFKLNR